MNSQQKMVNLFTICRKAGKLVLGYDAVKEAVFEGSVSCVLVMEDISDKTLKEVLFFSNNAKIEVVHTHLDSDDVMGYLGKQCVVVGVADFGFAKRFKELGGVLKQQ